MNALDYYRKIESVKKQPEISSLRGNPHAKILLIAPPCTQAEYNAQVPFSDNSARLFHDMLVESTGLDTDKDCLVVSCSRYGTKANKHSTGSITNFVVNCARNGLFKLYVCVGSTAFKFIFGYGKSSAMETIAGNVMYVEQTGYEPLFVFPDVAALYFDESHPEPWLAQRLQQDTERKFRLLFPKLKNELVKLKLK